MSQNVNAPIQIQYRPPSAGCQEIGTIFLVRFRGEIESGGDSCQEGGAGVVTGTTGTYLLTCHRREVVE